MRNQHTEHRPGLSHHAALVAACMLAGEGFMKGSNSHPFVRFSDGYRSTRRRSGLGTDADGRGKRNRLAKRRARKGYR